MILKYIFGISHINGLLHISQFPYSWRPNHIKQLIWVAKIIMEVDRTLLKTDFVNNGNFLTDSMELLHFTHLDLEKSPSFCGQHLWKYFPENFCILTKVSLNFIGKVPVENKSPVFHVLAWWWLISLGYKCFSWPQWVNSYPMWFPVFSRRFHLLTLWPHPTTLACYLCDVSITIFTIMSWGSEASGKFRSFQQQWHCYGEPMWYNPRTGIHSYGVKFFKKSKVIANEYMDGHWWWDGGVSFVISVHDDIIKWKQFLLHWPMWGELTADQWIPLTKANDAELWCYLWSVPQQRLNKQLIHHDLRHQHAHHDIVVMVWSMSYFKLLHCCIKCHTMLHHIVMSLEYISNFALAFIWFNPRYESGGISISNK